MNMQSKAPDFSKQDGLIPAVIQDYLTGEVLMLGYMDVQAYQLTVETGEVHFFSRSRQRLWKKGETSGNILHLVDMASDCDKDALLVRVRPPGPVCHRGTRSCFEPGGKSGFLFDLARLIRSRRVTPEGASYTSGLFQQGMPRMAQKLGEEATETLIEALRGDQKGLILESADLLFHLLVLLEASDVPLDSVIEELESRHRLKSEDVSRR